MPKNYFILTVENELWTRRGGTRPRRMARVEVARPEILIWLPQPFQNLAIGPSLPIVTFSHRIWTHYKIDLGEKWGGVSPPWPLLRNRNEGENIRRGPHCSIGYTYRQKSFKKPCISFQRYKIIEGTISDTLL